MIVDINNADLVGAIVAIMEPANARRRKRRARARPSDDDDDNNDDEEEGDGGSLEVMKIDRVPGDNTTHSKASYG